MTAGEPVTGQMCTLQHQLVESRLETLRQKDKALEDQMKGIEKRIETLDCKLDALLILQQNLLKYLLWVAVGVILLLIGVIGGRVVDLWWLI